MQSSFRRAEWFTPPSTVGLQVEQEPGIESDVEAK